MWARETRGLYERKGVRYPSDLSDAEWVPIAPAKRGGRRGHLERRLIEL